MITRQLAPSEGSFRFKSGHIYKFKYNKYQNDPEPLIFLMYGVKGQHPKTGHTHNYLLAINLSYINRNNRKRFVREWVDTLIRTNGNIPVTYKRVVEQFPFMVAAVRRYLLSRNDLFDIREIPLESIGEVVVGTMMKDYSKKAILEMMKNWKGESNQTKMAALKVALGESSGGNIPDLGTGFFGRVLGIAKEVVFEGKLGK